MPESYEPAQDVRRVTLPVDKVIRRQKKPRRFLVELSNAMTSRDPLKAERGITEKFARGTAVAG